MRQKIILFATCLLLASCAPAVWKDNFGTERNASIPKPVRNFVIRAQDCVHFSGEEGYDAARRAFLDKMMKETCTGLTEERANLLKRFAGNNEVAAIIAEVWEGFD